jgi:fibrillarin-like pre-rRNA processing protein
MIKPHEKFEEVYWAYLEDGSKSLATKNLVPGIKVYDEKLINYMNVEYRLWNPYRSKLAAAILNGLKELPIKPSTKVLYLGSATGTTVSHVSDIVGEKGIIYAVDIAPRVMREFLTKCAQHRKNIIPVLADARKPKSYYNIVDEVDVIYTDIAQPQQAAVVIANSEFYLKKGGKILFIIKAMSIDVTQKADITFQMEIDELKNSGFNVIQTLNLEPYDIDHALVLASY